jgi:hypothetical protein
MIALYLTHGSYLFKLSCSHSTTQFYKYKRFWKWPVTNSLLLEHCKIECFGDRISFRIHTILLRFDLTLYINNMVKISFIVRWLSLANSNSSSEKKTLQTDKWNRHSFQKHVHKNNRVLVSVQKDSRVYRYNNYLGKGSYKVTPPVKEYPHSH